MGLFNAINEFIRKRRERQKAASRFRSYVDPALVDYVLSNPDGGEMALRETQIEFVVMIVSDDDLSRLPKLLAEAIDVLQGVGAWFDVTSGSLVFATFGTFPNQNQRTPRQQREEAVSQLTLRLGDSARIVHGGGTALVGDFTSGSKRPYSHYGSGLHHFGEVLKVLVSLGPGQTREWEG